MLVARLRRLRRAVPAGSALVALALAALPLRAQTAGGAPAVAVLDFTNSAIGRGHEELAPLSAGISDLLALELAGNPRLRLVERKQVRRLLDEQQLAAGEHVDAQTAVRVGRLLGARHVILGGFVTDRSGTMHLHARAVDTETGVVEHVERASDRADNFMALVGRLARQLNDGLRLPAAPAREVAAAPLGSVPFQAVLLYARAVRAEDTGDRSQALELYARSLEQCPGYAPARRALDRIGALER